MIGQLARGLRFVLVAAALSNGGCGGSATPKAQPKPSEAPRLHRGPLTDYVAAAGLRWMVLGRPAELAANPEFAGSVSSLFEARRLDAFAATTGVDLRRTPSALAAGFDYGTLYMAETPGNNAPVEELFMERLVRGASVERPHPDLHRVSGLVGNSPQTLIRIDGQLIAVAVGDPTPARVVEAFARRRLSRSPPALRGAALSTLPLALTREPVAFYAPGPFDSEWQAGARGLLAGTTAVGAAARPSSSRGLEVRVYLAGGWGDDANAQERLTLAWADLVTSPLGHLLGLDGAPVPLVEATAGLLSVQVELELEPLVRGLRAAVAADAREILDLYRPSGVKSPVPQKSPGESGAADAGNPDPEPDPGRKR
jgi:hypothetical protein